MSKPALSLLGALAVELRPGAQPAQPAGAALAPAEAGALAQRIARELEGFAPGAEQLDFALAGALYDPVELLRPGWPLHAALERLAAQAPGAGGTSRVLGFGAAAGGLPPGLAPEDEHAGGPLRLLPWLLRGEATVAMAIGARLEADLLEAGMVGADTALQVQEAFATPVEHARLMTVHDLAAMMALQYEHAGLGALWPLIEAALLAPEAEAWLDAAPEPLARYAGGDVRIAMLDAEAWFEQGFAPAGVAEAGLGRAYERFQARQRQFAALLAAHGLGVTFDHCPAGRDPREVLRA